MLTVVLGLGSALGYALHDFLMVKVVRAVAVWTAMSWSMGVGLVILLPLALVLYGPPSGAAEWRAVGFAMAGGLCEAAALACLLRGLVTGNLSIVTPLASLAGGFVAVIADRRRRVALDAGDDRPAAGRRRRPARLGREGAGRGGVRLGGPERATSRRRGAAPALSRSPAAPAARPAPAGPCSRRPCSPSSSCCWPRPPRCSRWPSPPTAGWAPWSSCVPVALLLAGLRLPRRLAGRCGVAGVVRRRGVHPLRRGDRHRAAGGRLGGHRPGRDDGGAARLPRAARAAVAAAVRGRRLHLRGLHAARGELGGLGAGRAPGPQAPRSRR